MDPAQALADLTEISSQIEVAVVFDRDGNVVASTLDDSERSGKLVRSALDLLTAAEAVRSAEPAGLAQLDATTPDGSVFVVRDDDRVAAATTGPEPTVGLVFYDLKSCLRSIAAEPEAPAAATQAKPEATTRVTRKPRARSTKADADA
jgi:predicted regulator of Ras-like GTPase activity (Roadblock/LC7/MglB family)